jgi:hypothetical protein
MCLSCEMNGRMSRILSLKRESCQLGHAGQIGRKTSSKFNDQEDTVQYANKTCLYRNIFLKPCKLMTCCRPMTDAEIHHSWAIICIDKTRSYLWNHSAVFINNFKCFKNNFTYEMVSIISGTGDAVPTAVVAALYTSRWQCKHIFWVSVTRFPSANVLCHFIWSHVCGVMWFRGVRQRKSEGASHFA